MDLYFVIFAVIVYYKIRKPRSVALESKTFKEYRNKVFLFNLTDFGAKSNLHILER